MVLIVGSGSGITDSDFFFAHFVKIMPRKLDTDTTSPDSSPTVVRVLKKIRHFGKIMSRKLDTFDTSALGSPEIIVRNSLIIN